MSSETHWTYRCEYVRCGKKTCKSCPHGPYWYGYSHVGKKVKKKYFGKVDPRIADRPKQIDPREAIFTRSSASAELAREILGVSREDSKDFIRRRARELMFRSHPDICGDDNEFRYFAAAWSYLQKTYGW